MMQVDPNDVQVRITNIRNNQPRVLAIKASHLVIYVDRLRKECNTLSEPKKYVQFGFLPLLEVFDIWDTKEKWQFKDFEDLPTETIKNSKDEEVLVIIPEDDPRGVATVNYEPVKRDKNGKPIKDSKPFKENYANPDDEYKSGDSEGE